MVALERRPSRWAARWTSSQVSASALPGQICRADRGAKISAPPPGRLPRPAAMSSSSTAATGRPASCGEPGDLDGRERLQVQPRKGLVQAADDAHVPAERLRRMAPPTMCNSVQPASAASWPRASNSLLVEHIGRRVAGVATVGAQRAAIDADVGGVQMGVDVVIDRVAVAALADQIGQLAHGVQIDRGGEEQFARRRPTAAGRLRPCRGSCSSVAGRLFIATNPACRRPAARG